MVTSPCLRPLGQREVCQCSVLRHGDCSTTRRDSVAIETCSCCASPCPTALQGRPGMQAVLAMAPSKPHQLCRGCRASPVPQNTEGWSFQATIYDPLLDLQAKHVMFPSSYALLIPGWGFEATKGPVCARLSSPVGLINFSAVSGGLRARKGQCDVFGGHVWAGVD